MIMHTNYIIPDHEELSAKPLSTLSPQDFMTFLIYVFENIERYISKKRE